MLRKVATKSFWCPLKSLAIGGIGYRMDTWYEWTLWHPTSWERWEQRWHCGDYAYSSGGPRGEWDPSFAASRCFNVAVTPFTWTSCSACCTWSFQGRVFKNKIRKQPWHSKGSCDHESLSGVCPIPSHHSIGSQAHRFPNQFYGKYLYITSI